MLFKLMATLSSIVAAAGSALLLGDFNKALGTESKGHLVGAGGVAKSRPVAPKATASVPTRLMQRTAIPPMEILTPPPAVPNAAGPMMVQVVCTKTRTESSWLSRIAHVQARERVIILTTTSGETFEGTEITKEELEKLRASMADFSDPYAFDFPIEIS